MIIFGHRGAKGEAPENTVAGFRYARSLGIDAFELDVRLSADDQLVVMHDPTTDRTTAGSGPVSAFEAAKLAQLDARAEHQDWPTPVGVPTLAEVLEGTPDVARWELEIKTDTPERLRRICVQIPPLIERYGLQGRVTVSSFDPVVLEMMAEVAPDVPRGLIGAFDSPSFIDTALKLSCSEVSMPLRSGSAEMVRAAHAAGLRVTGWLGNTADEVRTLLDWGVDHITTDFPTTAMKALRRA